MDVMITVEETYLNAKKSHKSKIPPIPEMPRKLTVIDRLPMTEYLIADDLFNLGLVDGSDFMLQWLEWGIAPKFTTVKPIMAIYKRSEVVELLKFLELKKKIAQQIVDEASSPVV